MSELQEAVLLARRDGKEAPAADVVEVQKQVLNKMVEHRLQVQEARREKKDGSFGGYSLFMLATAMPSAVLSSPWTSTV